MRILVILAVLAAAGAAQSATYGQRVVAAVLMGEAGGEGRAGMVAVVEVLRTRGDSRRTSMLAEAVRPKQFSCLNGTSPEDLISRYEGSPGWDTALEIARMAYNTPERLPGVTRGATHYHARQADPYWARGRQPVVTIGNHVFYRL